jgi:hypothetical protein
LLLYTVVEAIGLGLAKYSIRFLYVGEKLIHIPVIDFLPASSTNELLRFHMEVISQLENPYY